MKQLIFLFASIALLQSTPQVAAAQSPSFQAFRDKFAGEDDVHYFKLSGFIVRSVLAMAGEPEARVATRGIHKVRLAVVPRDAFKARQVTVQGFRQVLRQDAFDELLEFRDNGDQVTVYSNSPRHSDDQSYMMLVESDDEIVLIEINGKVDEHYFKDLVKLHYQQSSI
jgi:hypothetical protein